MTARRPNARVGTIRLRIEGIEGAVTPADVTRAVRLELATLSPEQWRRLAADPTRKVVLDHAGQSAAKAVGRALKGGET